MEIYQYKIGDYFSSKFFVMQTRNLQLGLKICRLRWWWWGGDGFLLQSRYNITQYLGELQQTPLKVDKYNPPYLKMLA